jgi:large repetitive protein
LGSFAATAGVGTGLVPDYGAPDLRVFFGVGYAPRTPRDRDGDGIRDVDDACIDVPEDKDGFEDSDGCPEEDNDKDGILDGADKCPDVPENKNGFQDEDGCPDAEEAKKADRDNDGIADDVDRCADEPEDRDFFEDDDGCPEADNDKDGFLDAVDKCPNDAETKNEFEDDDGCPDEAPKKTVIKVTTERFEIKDKIQFEYNSDVIKPVSFGLLNDIYKVIQEHPEQKKIFIDGHSSNEGTDEYNNQLSRRRAESVRAYLVKKGVEAARLTATGFGETKPITADTSAAGRAQNRRVEFRLAGEGTQP